MTAGTLHRTLTLALCSTLAACAADVGAPNEPAAKPLAEDSEPSPSWYYGHVGGGGDWTIEDYAEMIEQAQARGSSGEAEAPSSDWYLGHAVGRSGLAALVLRAEGADGQPAVDVTFCAISAGACADADATGRAEVPTSLGRALIGTQSDTFVRSLINVTVDGPTADVTDIAYRLHTGAGLAAIYETAGVEADPALGTLAVETTGGSAAGVVATLHEVNAGQGVAGVYVGENGTIDPRLGETSSRGVVYFLNVTPGPVAVRFEHDGEDCSSVETQGWVSASPSSVDAWVVAGAVTLAGFVGCE